MKITKCNTRINPDLFVICQFENESQFHATTDQEIIDAVFAKGKKYEDIAKQGYIVVRVKYDWWIKRYIRDIK